MPRALSKGSIANRLTVWFTLSAVFVLVLNSAVAYWGLATTMEREDDEHLISRIELLRSLLQATPDDVSALKAEIEGSGVTGRFTEYLVRVLDAKGKVVAETPGMAKELDQSMFPPPVFAARPAAGHEVTSPLGRQYHVMAATAEMEKGTSSKYVLQVAMNRTYEEVVMARLRTYLAGFLIAALAVCAWLGRRIARQGLQPVAQMIRTVERIRSATLNERVPVQDLPVELSELGSTFNTMMDHLEESFRRLSQFSSNLAHELRTPVNNLRGEVEVALGQTRTADEYRETLHSVHEECLRLGRLIDALLFLARADAAQTAAERRPIDLATELGRIRDFFEAAAAEAGVELTVDVPGVLTAQADSTLFQRAVANLVANALDHTPSGGAIHLAARQAGGIIEVEVADTGKGIPPEALPRVFDRFFRAHPASPGRLGLGLAIVKSVAQLHGGSVRIASEPGKGTRVIFELPC